LFLSFRGVIAPLLLETKSDLKFGDLAMAFDYDEFRTKSWDERVTLFTGLSTEQKAHLVRTHIGRWLEAHRAELDAAQIAFLEKSIAFIQPELYAVVKDPGWKERMKALEVEGAALLTREQMREALTMHWR
jgi:hypothetical protein